ncbi:hypothetical protein SF23_12695 [Streptomyces sp. MBRL 10]|nr:hypothetical protein SF23_12695 [Streptomyces sp. MBRL 10]
MQQLVHHTRDFMGSVGQRGESGAHFLAGRCRRAAAHPVEHQYWGCVTSIRAMASRSWRMTAACARPVQYPTGWEARRSSGAAGSAGA